MLYRRSPRLVNTGILCFQGLAVLLLLTGCQSEPVPPTSPSSEATTPAAPTNATPLTIREVSRESLQLEDVLSDPFVVEPGKLEIASPLKWGLAPRSSNYVARFSYDRTRRTRLPRIWITATPADGSEIETVTADNVIAYAEQLANQLKNDSKGPLLESVKPMIIADRPCARYVRKTRFIFKDGGNERAVVAERQILQTIVQGRQFSVELHVLPGEIRQFRDISYAVLAGINFLQEADPVESTPDKVPPGEPDKPADESP